MSGTPLAGLRTRAQFRAAPGVLLVMREVSPAAPATPGQPAVVPGDPGEGAEILVAIGDDGEVVVLHGHVDLGTGLRTAIARMVAEELDVDPARVTVEMGDTARVPNQGPTIASGSIQTHSAPQRTAAAQARAWLVARAARRFGVGAEALVTRDGFVVASRDDAMRIAYGELFRGEHHELLLDPSTPLAPVSGHRYVGRPAQRVDIPAKVAGAPVFVHDLRLPGMLHGRVIRPPYAGMDAGDFVGRSLESVDRASIGHIPGIVAVVVQGDFVGVVAQREDQAERAMRELAVRWKPCPSLPPLDDLATALSANPARRRTVATHGDVDAALRQVDQRIDRTYVWPYQLHASIGPSCAVAHWHGEDAAPALTVWAGTQNPFVLRQDIARLCGLADAAVDLVRLEAAGCYGRNCADDVAADAALLARVVGAPVRVQLTREQEHLWEPKGAAQRMDVRGGLDRQGALAAYHFTTAYPSNGAPTLALLLTRTIEPAAEVYAMGDRTSVPPYDYAALRVDVDDMAPILRASWLRGVSALPNSFAHESYVDELANAAGADPVDFRMRHLSDPRAQELVRTTAARAEWQSGPRPRMAAGDGDWLEGQGFAFARYSHGPFPGTSAAWAAWVAHVAVHRRTGEVDVRRVVVGQDAGQLVDPAGVVHQVHGNVLQTTSRALREQVAIDPVAGRIETREWGSYPIIGFRDVPLVEVVNMPRQHEPPLGVGESASVPGTAAIANAIFDATGIRLRQPPFTPEVVRAAMGLPDPTTPGADAHRADGATGARPTGQDRSGLVQRSPPSDAPWPRRRLGWRIPALATAIVGAAAGLLGRSDEIAPVARHDGSLYSASALERGRALALAGNCASCHTAPGGRPNAGGRRIDTPFGSIVSSNITPDLDSGIGTWSFSAFERAMREGISRDGHHLYPVFPYTSFARVSEDDLAAIYAWLMAQPPVRNRIEPTRLDSPLAARPLLRMWNALFGPAPGTTAVPGRSPRWNRGAYLVEGLAHCGACHTPRNVLGAERDGQSHFAGAWVDGWEAPPLTAASTAPVPWTEQGFFDYLRRGHSPEHGNASGPMAEVVRNLAALPDEDIRAMAAYLSSFGVPAAASAERASDVVAAAARAGGQLRDARQRMFETACGPCHHDGDGPQLLGRNIPLALASNLHSERPDNLIRVILEGIQEPPGHEVGFMPGFRALLGDRQIATLVGYMRERFAPGRPPWGDVETTVARLRAASTGSAATRPATH